MLTMTRALACRPLLKVSFEGSQIGWALACFRFALFAQSCRKSTCFIAIFDCCKDFELSFEIFKKALKYYVDLYR